MNQDYNGNSVAPIEVEVGGVVFNVAPEVVARFLPEVGTPILNEAARAARLAAQVELAMAELRAARQALAKSFVEPDMWSAAEVAKAAKSAALEGFASVVQKR